MWFRKAAEQGYDKAQYQLAEMYNNGQLGDNQRSNCIPWYLKAAAQGNAGAKTEVGELPNLYPNNELLKSVNNIEMLQQSAEQGNLDAQFQLARRYQTGIGVPKDAVEAFKWMQKAAQNNVDAMYYLALMYEKSEGVTQDLSEAHRLFLEAAGPVFRLPDAMFRVGQMYEKGDGVLQNDHIAMNYYCGHVHDPDHPEYVVGYNPGDGGVESVLNLWAQGRGFPDEKDKAENDYREPNDLINYFQGLIITARAEFYAGQIYYQGKLVPQDLVESDARFRVAANQNLDDARKMLDELEPKLSPAQKEAAKSRFLVLENAFEMATQREKDTESAHKFISW